MAYLAIHSNPPELKDLIVERMEQLYNWRIEPDDVIFPPGVVIGLSMTAKSIGKPGDAVLMQTPVYGPFLRVPTKVERFGQHVPLIYVQDDAHTFHYEIDFDAFEVAAANPQTTLFFQCNPHNPGGFTYSRNDLERIADICMKHDVMICADEIHSDLCWAMLSISRLRRSRRKSRKKR